MNSNSLRHAIVAGLFSVLTVSSPGLLAQVTTVIVPDVTLPNGSHSLILPSGSRVDIAGGHAAGPNLFHSFADFHVGAGDTANFFGQGASNILSRVTGANPSNLFGTLGVDTHLPEGTRSSANLFFLNPKGVVFGPNAALDLKGSFYVSTADDIRLGTGSGPGLFSATDPGSDILTSAPPAAFGFLGDTSPVLAAGRTAGISIQGLDTQGSSVVILGRDAGAGAGGPEIPGVEITGRLASQGGNVTLSSVHAAGSAGVDALNLQEFSEGGRISLTEAGVVDVTHPFDPFIGGRIVIRGGQFTMIGKERQDPTEIPSGALLASVANGPAPAIDVEVTDSLLIESGTLTTSTAGANNAGSVSLTGKNVTLSDSLVSSDTAELSTGNAGDISVTGETVTVTGSLRISEDSSGAETVTGNVSSFTSTAGQGSTGNAGTVSVTGLTVTLTNGGHFISSTFGAGDAGSVSVTGETVTVTDGTFSSFTAFGDGAAGSVSVTGETVTVTDSSFNSSTSGDGAAGSVSMTGETVTLTNSFLSSVGSISVTGETVTLTGGSLNSDNEGMSDAGFISVTGETVTLTGVNLQSTSSFGEGAAGNVSVTGKTLTFMNSHVFTDTTEAGDAGSINVTGETVTLTGSHLSSNTFRGGAGGDVNVTGEIVSLTDGSLSSSTFGDSEAGDVILNVGRLDTKSVLMRSSGELKLDQEDFLAQGFNGNAGSITIQGKEGAGTQAIEVTLVKTEVVTTQSGSGDGGAITIEVAGKSPLSLIDSILNASVKDRPEGSDTSGGLANITVRAPSIHMIGGSIQTETTGTRPGGIITLNADHTLSLTQTQISAQSTGTANAGGIQLTASDTISLDQSTITTGATDASGGNINLTAPNMIQLIDSTIETSVQGDVLTKGGNISLDPDFVVLQNSQILAKAAAGAGGRIDVVGNVVLMDPFSVIDASSQFGISGSVNIQAPIQNLSGSIAPLPGTIVEVASLYNANCAGQKGGALSSFTVQGRDRIPLEPGELLPTPIFLAGGPNERAPTSNLPVLPMATRLHLPDFEGRLLSQHLSDIFHGGCHS